MDIEDEEAMLCEKLLQLLEAAGRACVGMDGIQVVQLLGGLSAQLEATLLRSMPRDTHEDITLYLAGARATAYAAPLMTLDAQKQIEA